MKKFNEMTWEERKEIIDKANDELINKIDYEPLYKEIRKVVNDDSIKFNHEILEYKNGKYIEIYSEELINKVGLMSVALKSIKLATFNSSIEFDVETLKAYWWGSIDFTYKIADGGTNGMHVLYFKLKDGNYTFDSVKK